MLMETQTMAKERNPFKTPAPIAKPARRSKVPWAELEPVINLARNKLKTNDTQLQRLMGITDSNFGMWRKTGFGPGWAIPAIRGVLAEHSVEGDIPSPQLHIGMRFTNDQLELLNRATSGFARAHPDEASAAKKLRAAILLELAARLDHE